MAAAVDVADDALRINHKGGAFGHAQKTKHAVLARDLLFRVAQQGKREAQFLCKGTVGLRLVHADAQNLGAFLFKTGKTILVCLEFLRSARRVGVNVESQDDAVFPAEITKPDELACMVSQLKIRRRVSDVQCHPGRIFEGCRW